jgi:transposase InsO family protein
MTAHATRWWLYLKHKSDVVAVVTAFSTQVQRQFNAEVRYPHTDNGGEFVNEKLKAKAVDKGWVHETTAPYNPEQNGRGERILLHDCELANSLWLELIRTSTDLRNRGPTSTLNMISPFEALSGH